MKTLLFFDFCRNNRKNGWGTFILCPNTSSVGILTKIFNLGIVEEITEDIFITVTVFRQFFAARCGKSNAVADARTLNRHLIGFDFHALNGFVIAVKAVERLITVGSHNARNGTCFDSSVGGEDIHLFGIFQLEVRACVTERKSNVFAGFDINNVAVVIAYRKNGDIVRAVGVGFETILTSMSPPVSDEKLPREVIYSENSCLV